MWSHFLKNQKMLSSLFVANWIIVLTRIVLIQSVQIRLTTNSIAEIVDSRTQKDLSILVERHNGLKVRCGDKRRFL